VRWRKLDLHFCNTDLHRITTHVFGVTHANARLETTMDPVTHPLIVLALAAGALLNVQAGANAQLSKALDSPFAATTVQLFVAALILLGIATLTGSIGALALLPQATWWHSLGGIASAVFVVASIILFPRIGAVVSVGLIIAGQMLASAAIDMFGLFGARTIGLGPGLGVGVLGVVGGAAVLVFGQAGAKSAIGLGQAGLIGLALLAGVVLPVQGAVNALLRQDLGGATFAVAFVSFVVATLAMGAVLIATQAMAIARRPSFRGLPAMPWWGWLGGVVGATYVITVFTALPVIGASATIGLTVAGQQIASILVDKFGWFRLPERSVSGPRLLGVALVLIGVVIIRTAQPL
jgi:bacterial/archaeal transporter family-2 protein